MDQTACVDAPAFPLQLLLKHHPGWASQPVAVVDRDSPRGRILWVNDLARRHRVSSGYVGSGAALAAGHATGTRGSDHMKYDGSM